MSRSAYPWWLEPASALGAALLWLLGSTWRVDQRDDEEYERALRSGERFVYVIWHARLLPLVHTHRREGVAVLVSTHRDGQLITRIIERSGFVAARGSSTRGGDAGVREMLAFGEAGRSLAITPDGPRGPAEHAKEGPEFLARRLGRRVVPVASSSQDRSTWVFRSWDRFRVPRPFARVAITHGRPIMLADAAEAARASVEEALRRLTDAVAARAGETR